MSRHAAPRRRRSIWTLLKSARLRAALGLCVVFALASSGTFAYWTDQATVTGGTFEAGRLDMKVGDPAVDNDPPAFTTSFAMTNMVPGSVKDAPLKLSNVGTVAFTSAVTGSASNATAGELGSAIRISVYPSVTSGACSGAPLVANVAPSAVTFTLPALAAGATRDLCFRATLPTDASPTLQGKTTQVSFVFNATQVLP